MTPIVQHEVGAAKQKLTTAEHEFTVAKNKLTTAKWKLTVAKKELATAEHELTTAEHELDLAEHELVSARQELAITKHGTTAMSHRLTAAQNREAAESRFRTTESRCRTAESMFEAAGSMLTTAKAKFAAAEAESATMEHKCATVECRFTAAEHGLDIAKQKLATTEHEHTVIIVLDKLATDCLRLSMHFFHPIQQCAQQVYHTAVPLSPISSQLHGFCLKDIVDNQLSPVIAFSGAPHSWGLLLRTIDVRPMQLTCIATSIDRIVAACEDIVNIYDAVTGVLQQSLHAPEAVIKIQGSPDGSTLFFGHSLSVTMWDVQTGGLVHTFTTQSTINDIAVSMAGDHIACGLYDGSITFWDVHSKEGGKGVGGGQPVVTICWLAPLELAVATQTSVYMHSFAIGETSNILSFPDQLCGMVYLADKCGVAVGTSMPSTSANQEVCSLRIVGHIPGHLRVYQPLGPPWTYLGRLTHPTLVGNDIVWISPPSGVQSFNISSNGWAKNPPLLDLATSVAVSLGRNLVVQTEDSIQIFSLDVLTIDGACDDVHTSHVYPLGEQHIICLLQPNRRPILLKLETLQELCPNDNALSLRSLLMDQAATAHVSLGHGLVAEFGISVITQAWQSGTPLPEWAEAVNEDPPLSGLSPNCTWSITAYSSPQPELRVRDATDGNVLANLSLENADLGLGKVYDLTFDSETRFNLKIDGPGWHVQIPYDITPSPLGDYSHAITKGELVHLSEPRATSPYSLDANCEWVVDAESRKICWISPGNVRRGNGGHFWAGLSLVMVGDDGVVRKLTFKEPDC